jgi:hypothetical protein
MYKFVWCKGLDIGYKKQKITNIFKIMRCTALPCVGSPGFLLSGWELKLGGGFPTLPTNVSETAGRIFSSSPSYSTSVLRLLINNQQDASSIQNCILSRNSTCFGHLLCSSSGVISCTRGNWYASCRLCGRYLGESGCSTLTLLGSGHITW